MDKMRILLISPFYAPVSRVSSVRMVSLSRYLVKQGHEVTAFTIDEKWLAHEFGEKCMSTPVPEGVETICFHLPICETWRFGQQRRAYSDTFSCALEDLLKRRSFDVALISCGPFYTLISLPGLMKKYRTPYLLDFRDLGVLDKWPDMTSIKEKCKLSLIAVPNYLVERRSVKAAAHVVTVCPGDAKKIQRAYRVSDDDISVIYNGYDDEVLSKTNSYREKSMGEAVRIGYFGKLMYYSPERGTWLLQAIDRIRKEKGINISLHHIGTPNPRILETIQALQLDPAVYVGYGDMSYQNGMETMQEMDILASEYVHPTGLGTKIFDYIYLNRPVISVSPREIYLSKFMQQFENGFVCNSADEIYTAICKIISEDKAVLDKNMHPETYSRSIQNQRFEALFHLKQLH